MFTSRPNYSPEKCLFRKNVCVVCVKKKCSKKFVFKKCLCSKMFVYKKSLCTKKVCVQKKFVLEKVCVQKKSLVFCIEENVDICKTVCVKYMSLPGLRTFRTMQNMTHLVKGHVNKRFVYIMNSVLYS